MEHKGWVIPIVVGCICGLILVFYTKDSKGIGLTQATYAASASDTVWYIPPTDIKKVEFTFSGNTISAFLNQQEEWQLLTPLHALANQRYISSILASFHHLQASDILQVAEETLPSYGIEKISPAITLYDASYNAYELVRGKEKDAAHYYVYSPSHKVLYTMPKSAFDLLVPSVTEWRERDYLHFSPSHIAKVSFVTNGTSHEIFPTDSDPIRFSSPTLSAFGVEELERFLKVSKVKDFIIEEANDSVITMYGLDHPDFKLTLTTLDGQSTTFYITPSSTDIHKLYVMNSANKEVFSIPFFDFSKVN